MHSTMLYAVNQMTKLDDENKSLNRTINDYITTTNKLKEDFESLEKDLALTSQFNQGMYDKYIQEFNRCFSSAAPMHPIPTEMKAMFTQTIYAIAFHYLSYNKVARKSASADDELNLEMATGKSNGENGKQKVSLKDELNIQMVSGLIIYIAEELKKNGVTSLSDVNFRGYYFKD